MTGSRDGKDRQETEPPREMDQAAPTIVGGRPPRNRNPSSGFPLGIEVLLKKASVDREFRKALVEKRSAAAAEIGLDLSPSEAAVLDTVPRSHIEKIIDRTTIPDEHRRVFLGKVAAAMLALLGIPLPAASERKRFDVAWEFRMGGCTVDRPRYRTPPPRRARVGRLRLGVLSTENNSVAVQVDYECTFEKGEVTIDFRRDDNSEGATITVEPRRFLISRGKGRVIFFVKGREGETQWLLVGIRSTSVDCVNAPWVFLDWRDHRESDREYYGRGCALCRVIPYVKQWT